MKPRGSYDPSDYAWSSVLRDAANVLMDEGAGDRPLSFQQIAQAVRQGASEGDLLRAAFQVEGHKDRDRGAEILTTEALRSLKKSKLIEETDEGFRWIANGRVSFKAHGKTIPLVPKEERERQRERALIEAQFITKEGQLPGRTFKPDTPESKALIVSLKASGFDDDFPILVDEEGEIVDGWQRAGACELVGIDWRNHTRTVRFTHSGPPRNMERTGKAVRANIGSPLSLATRKALAKKLKLQGNTTAEIAEALGVTDRWVRKLVSTVTEEPSSAVTPEPRLSDEELVSLFMEEIKATPEAGVHHLLARLRDKGYAFRQVNGQTAIRTAKSRLAVNAPPPAPPPPEPVRMERFVMRRYRQVVVDDEVVHNELVSEWADSLKGWLDALATWVEEEDNED